MVYLFPPKVIKTETNMDIEAKSKITILFVESHLATYWGVERQKWAHFRVYSADASEGTREYQDFSKRTCDILSNSSPFQSAHESAGYEGQEKWFANLIEPRSLQKLMTLGFSH